MVNGDPEVGYKAVSSRGSLAEFNQIPEKGRLNEEFWVRFEGQSVVEDLEGLALVVHSTPLHMLLQCYNRTSDMIQRHHLISRLPDFHVTADIIVIQFA